MRLWTCWNAKCTTDGGPLGFHFSDDGAGKCPRCGVDPKHPTCGFIVTPAVVVHFDPPSGIVSGIGQRICACDGNPIGQRRATGHWKPVNCPACKKTPAYAAERDANSAEVHPDFAVPLSGDGAKGKLDLVAAPPVETKTGGCG